MCNAGSRWRGAVNDSDVMIVRIALPDRAVLLLQGLLSGQDGLATLRDRPGGLELWSTWAQRGELDDWLESLPPGLELRQLGRYAFRPLAGAAGSDEGEV
jgi:hypothetical protein